MKTKTPRTDAAALFSLDTTMGEPMGFDCSSNQKRYDELKAERDRIQKEWDGQ
jgi:hypothetical protein